MGDGYLTTICNLTTKCWGPQQVVNNFNFNLIYCFTVVKFLICLFVGGGYTIIKYAKD